MDEKKENGNVYSKLQSARMALLGKDLKKSGYNTYSKYSYFELGDFLPATQEIFYELGLCGYISFTNDMATLRIVNVNDPTDQFTITSPMSSAKLTACHEVQNLGAVESYLRRYLWITALELAETDELDRGAGPEKATPKQETKVLTKKQAEEIKAEIQNRAVDLKKFLAVAGSKTIEGIAADRFDGLMAQIKTKPVVKKENTEKKEKPAPEKTENGEDKLAYDLDCPMHPGLKMSSELCKLSACRETCKVFQESVK